MFRWGNGEKNYRFSVRLADCQNVFLWHSWGMKLLLVLATVILGLGSSARAQQEADEKYLNIYSLIQTADALAAAGEPRDAVAGFTDAQGQLDRFKKTYPTWNPDIIAYRLNDLAQKISTLKGSSALKAVEKPVVTEVVTNDATAAVKAQLTELQAQLQAAQTENGSLQAKLKEALAAQPAAISASELARAQQQVADLMKANDLLKVSATKPPEVITIMDTNAVASAKTELAAYVQKYAAERARTEALSAENLELQKKLTAAAVPDDAALAALKAQNEKLKQQITAFNTTVTNLPDVGRLQNELKAAREEIAALRSAASLASLEKSALENRVVKLNADIEELRKANNDGRIRDLIEQKNELEQKLAAAERAGKAKTPKAASAVQLAALNEEIKTLRARVAVSEAKSIPFSTQELALFRQTSPKPDSTDPIRRSIKELPAGTTELVASAQRHFGKREYSEAEADYHKILQRDQNNGLALANLATIELQQNKLEDAEKHIKAAVAQSPDDAYNLSTLGYLKFRQEKYDEALNALSRAAEIDPQNPEIQNYLGVTLSHTGQRAQGETALRKAIQLAGNYAPAHNNLAVIYLSQEPPLPQLARWHYQKALDAGQPRNPDLEKMLSDKGAPVDAP
jgi:Tfp pilus assembly protein PilF